MCSEGPWYDGRAYVMGLPGHMGGCQYIANKQIEKQNIGDKIGPEAYPQDTDLNLLSLKCHDRMYENTNFFLFLIIFNSDYV